MALLLILLFIVTPFVELFLLLRVGGVIGLGPTLGLVVAMGFLGASLARTQGRRVLRDWQAALSEGRVPERGIVSGMLILLGALLLVTPGFLSDLFGLVLLIPATRKPLEVALIGYLKNKVARGQLRVHGMGGGPGRTPPAEAPTEVGRAAYRPGDVIDTQGEEVDP